MCVMFFVKVIQSGRRSGCDYICWSTNQPVIKSVNEKEYDTAIQMTFIIVPLHLDNFKIPFYQQMHSLLVKVSRDRPRWPKGFQVG